MTELYDALRAQREQMRPAWRPEDTERALHGIEVKRVRRRRKKTARLAALSAALVGLGLWAAWPKDHTPPSAPPTLQEIALTNENIPTSLPNPSPPPQEPPPAVHLPDGSLILSHPGATARFELQAPDARRLEVNLLWGSATFDVTPNPEREFVVHASQISVHVLGTRFQVEHTPGGVLVHVDHGRVRVSKPGTQDVILTDAMTYTDAMTKPAPAPPKEKTSTPAAAPTATAAPWQKLARRAQYDQAARSLTSATPPQGVEALMLAADVMRYTKRPAEALTYLDLVVQRHPTDPRAPIAQFQRGRLLAKMNRHRQAAQAWAKVQELATVTPSIAEDALAQEAAAWYQVGEFSKAQARARTYLERYPTGHRSKAMKRYATPPTPPSEP